jgi:hypothetical protein
MYIYNVIYITLYMYIYIYIPVNPLTGIETNGLNAWVAVRDLNLAY